MNAYINNGAQHVMLDGTVVERDQVIECEENLAEKFPSKFKKVADTPSPIKQKQLEDKPKKEAKIPKKKGKKSAEMEDITKKITEFPIPEGYLIKKDSRGYWVYDGDKEPANEKPLKREEVEPFIKECVI